MRSAVADSLLAEMQRQGAHVLTLEEAGRLAARVGSRAISVAGMTSVTMLAALVRDARLALTSHTSVMHLADAFGTPVVIPFSGTDLMAQWAPRRTPHVLLQRATGCSPCYAFECPYGHECMTIPSTEVADAMLSLMNGTQAARQGAARSRAGRDAPYVSAGSVQGHA